MIKLDGLMNATRSATLDTRSKKGKMMSSLCFPEMKMASLTWKMELTLQKKVQNEGYI